MVQIFTYILSMSVTASVVILAVLLVRCAMGRLPKKYSYLLWLIVGIRLVCPFAIASPVSIFNIVGQEMPAFFGMDENGYTVEADFNDTAGTVSNQGSSGNSPSESSQMISNMEQMGEATDSYTADNQSESPEGASKDQGGTAAAEGEQPQQDLIRKYGMMVWSIGMIVLILWNLYAALRMKRHLARAVRYEGNIYECDIIPSPFVMGIVRPRIYIPFRLGVEEREYILKHEQYHIKRRDHVVKVMAFLLAVVYWFHPLVWLSYFLMIRDMEMSCDESVLQQMDTDIRKNYSKSLLGFATNRRGLTAGVLAFGETNTRRRVRNVMSFRKHGKWIGLVAILLVVGMAAICLTNASRRNEKKETQSKNSETATQGIVVSETKINGSQLKLVYVWEGKKPEKDGYGMYGGKFELQTYQKDQKCDSLAVEFPQMQTVYYPAAGFDFVVKDYDGDGSKNDFSLGQGQTEEPMLGNYMLYQFYSVDEDGSIIQYALSTDGGENIVTRPGEYSPNFENDYGEISYDGLEEANQTAAMVRIIPINAMGKEKQPEQKLLKAVESTMPQKVVDEFQERGVWRLTKGNYSLANNESSRNITLRLDFSYTGNVLTQYVSKEYGFVDAMPDEEISEGQAKELIRSFASAFLDEDINVLDIKKEIATADESEGKRITFSDASKNTYSVSLSKNMVVKFDASEKRIRELNSTLIADTGKSTYIKSIDTTIDLPESDAWIQKPITLTKKEGAYCSLSYHDGIADTDVTLRLWKKEKDISYAPFVKNHSAPRYWPVKCGSEEIKIKIERGTFATGEDEGVVLSWKYQDITCAMFANLPSEADDSSLAKAAAYITESWYAADRENS